MPRAIWKGAISFGLVHIPVNLYPAASEESLDLDLLDKRDFSPIGYRRINKTTGKEVEQQRIVKGYEYAKGRYVVLTDEDFRQANVEATQTVDIQAFVGADEVPAQFFSTPYYLEPGKRAEKGYVLLRETLRKAGRFALANVVLRTRQHLAAVIPLERLLLLVTLRYASEIRSFANLELPEAGTKGLHITAQEMDMAARLVEDMTVSWNPKAYKDTYRADLLARIERRVKSGKTHEIVEPEEGKPTQTSAQVIDLTEILKKSLRAKPKRAHTSNAKTHAIPLHARAHHTQRETKSTRRRRRV